MNPRATRSESALSEALSCALGEGGRAAYAHFERPKALEISAKRDGSPVSNADVTVEEVIRSRLLEATPSDQIVGEELGGSGSDAYWCVDPIDGTDNFLRGSPLWGVSIAYIRDGAATWGGISLPALGVTLMGSRSGGLTTTTQWDPSNRHHSARDVIAVGENPYWSPTEIGSVELLLREEGWGVTGFRCATVSLAFAALGYINGYVERRTNLWDVAAGGLLCELAGHQVSLTHRPVTPGVSIVAGSERLLDLVSADAG